MTLTIDDTSNWLCNSFTFNLSKLYMSMIITIGILCVIGLLLFLWKKTDFSIIELLEKRLKKRAPINVRHYIHSNKVTELDEVNLLLRGEQSKTDENTSQRFVGIIEVQSLPEWMDVSTSDSEIQRQEAYVRQMNAVTNFIASCNEAKISFCQVFHYFNGTLKCYIWSEYIFDRSDLTNQLQQLEQLIQIAFKGIKTEIKFPIYNPIIESFENIKFNKIILRGGYLSGDFVKEVKIEPLIIEQFNSFFRQEKKTGFLIISNRPFNQKGFFHSFQRFLANRKYSKLTSQSRENVSQSGIGGTKSIVKVNRKKQLELIKFEAKLKRLEARTISKVNFILFTCGLDSSIERGKHEADNSFSMAKTSLFTILQSSSQFPLDFHDFSADELEKLMQKISTCYIPNSPDHFDLLPEEAASLCRFPSLDTLPINREQKTVSQIHQPKIDTSGITLGKIISSDGSPSTIYNLNPDNLVLQTLVTGTTGSGKTSTLCALVILLEKLGIRSLIIDPKGVIFPILREFLSDIHIFEFGKESSAPGRCNILECPDWMDVQTHLNLVENILLSVWEIFPPMNMILHRALSRLYNSDGWSVRLNKHGKIRTLEDLRKEIQKIQNTMGYSKDTHLDITSAMEMRLDYFIKGQIGLQINCKRSIPITDLLNKTTVISLEHANNYAEKALVLTYLGRTFEYFKQKSLTDQLRHCLIIDEAEHYFGIDQLLLHDDYEKAAAGKATTKKLIEMIAQSRAYGLGIVISTQSSSKLPREIMINCNNKIIHKTIDGFDISYLQRSMRLTHGQANMLPVLKIGEAIITDLNNPYPFKIKVKLLEGLASAGKGLHPKQKELLLKNQMNNYIRENQDLFEIQEIQTSQEMYNEIKLNFPLDTSLLTDSDMELLNTEEIIESFKEIIEKSFDNTLANYSEEFSVIVLSDYLKSIRKKLDNGHEKASVIEFVDKMLHLAFDFTQKGRKKVLKRVTAIVNTWEK